MSHSAAGTSSDARHGLRIFLIWLPLAIIADLLIWFVWYPHLPPGRMSDQAQGQQFDIAVMTMLAAPVLLFVWTYFAYAIIVWRRRPGDDEDGPPLHSNTRVQATWITATAVIVLGLFVFGTVQLIVPAGAGAGEGPSPTWTPNTNNILQVQVIGQQWAFTYRFPQFGGMETTQLLLPKGEQVRFNVTSLDVIHSFWAYQLGVKADANPGVNNVAFAKPQQLELHRPLQRAMWDLARGHVQLRPRGGPRRVPGVGEGPAAQRGTGRVAPRPAAIRADLRPHGHPAARQGHREGGRHHRRQRLLLPVPAPVG